MQNKHLACTAAFLAAVLFLSACGSRSSGSSGSGGGAGSRSSSAGSSASQSGSAGASGSGAAASSTPEAEGDPFLSAPESGDIIGYTEAPDQFDCRFAILERSSDTAAIAIQLPFMIDFGLTGCDVYVNGERIDAVDWKGGVCRDAEGSEDHTGYALMSHDLPVYTAAVPAAEGDEITVSTDIVFWRMQKDDPLTSAVAGSLRDQILAVNADADDLYLDYHVLQNDTPVRLGGKWYVKESGRADTAFDDAADHIDKQFRFTPLTGEPDEAAFRGTFEPYDVTSKEVITLPEGCQFGVQKTVEDGKLVLSAYTKYPADEAGRAAARDLMSHVGVLCTGEDGSQVVCFI